MHYEVEIGGRVRRVVVHRSSGTFIVEVDDRQWTVDAQRIDGQSLSLLMEEGTNVVSGISRTCSHEVTVLPDLSGALNVYVRGTPVTLSLNGRGQRSRASRHGGADPAGGEPQRMVAPMPGRIVRVLAKPGEHVVARQSVVVIEAMKMENELRSARDGVVAEMHAREGQLVEAGALLAVIARRPE